jgi:hypothetical protein
VPSWIFEKSDLRVLKSRKLTAFIHSCSENLYRLEHYQPKLHRDLYKESNYASIMYISLLLALQNVFLLPRKHAR